MENGFVFTHPKTFREDMAVYDVRQDPFRLYGLYHPKEQGLFRRMPREVAEQTSKRVNLLHTNTAGARLRFATDSPYVSVGAVYPPMEFPSARTVAFCGVNAFSFDLYVDGSHHRVLWPETLNEKGSVVSFEIPHGKYEAGVSFSQRKIREITLCFPSFVNVSHLYIGLQKGCSLTAGKPYCNEKPVVFYGSSITQGACASRSGNIYQNILSRKLNFDYINLGFASGCKAEDSIVQYLCEMEMNLLVFDYDHNAKTPEFLAETHLKALRALRKAHPKIPFVVLSKPDQDTGVADTDRRAQIIEENCRIVREEGGAPVHFISGREIFRSHDSDMMTIDGTHPTDLGFHCMSEALYGVLKQYF